MPSFPQHGGCLCGEIRFTVHEDPVTVYACHCTDCQTETGSAFYLSVIVRTDAFAFTQGEPERFEVRLADGRGKGGRFCSRCHSPVGGGSSNVPGISSFDGGSFDDTSWIVPAGHIWTRSAQPWIQLAENTVRVAKEPSDEDTLAMVRAWKGRNPGEKIR